MLLALRVEQFILIDALELRLEPGYNALTGETGAGKSIVVGALELVLGRRASGDVVRPGATQAEVEALFDISGDEALVRRLEEAGIGCDGELVVRRVVQPTGRSRAYLNGRLCTARELGDLGPELADITSQHESASMADPKRHLEYLDRHAKLLGRRAELAALVEQLRATSAEIASWRDRARGRAEQEAFLRFQLEAIDTVAPEPDELEAARTERARLKHATRLQELSSRAATRLDDADGSLCDELGRVAADLAAAAELDPSLEPLAVDADACWSRLREVAADARRYAERIEADPERLEQVQDRIFRLEQLLRQHGPTVSDVLAAAARIRQELDELDQAADRLPALEEQHRQLLAEAARRARRLSARRQRGATELGRAISTELGQLDMGEARVVVEVRRAERRDSELVVDGARLGPGGIDRVQFLIAPNAGVEPRPLGRIASGGELSRALLALKRALGGYASAVDPARRGTGIQVFDEVDVGIGGATADRIGRAIADIARHRQVLCITHLAPIAAYADAHFSVRREASPSGAESLIGRLDGPARVAELARMLSGERVTGSTKRAAQELLAAAAARGPA